MSDTDSDEESYAGSIKNYSSDENEESEEEYAKEPKPKNGKKPEVKYEEDEEDFIKNAIKQIEEQEKKNPSTKPTELNQIQLKDLKITTEGTTQDQNKNINLQKVLGLYQCYWCLTYYKGEMIISEQGDSVCKHCYFCVNYTNSEEERLKFDTKCCTEKGQGIATYILECYENHRCDKCVRKPSCFLCDYKQGKQIKGIQNSDMLGTYDVKKVKTTSTTESEEVDSAEYLETHSNVIFNGFDNKTKFKVPKKLVL